MSREGGGTGGQGKRCCEQGGRREEVDGCEWPSL